MVNTRMEARVDTIEREVREIREQVGIMDSKVGALTVNVDSVEGQQGAITKFMREIKNMIKANNHEKNIEAGTSSLGVMEVQSATPKKAQSTPITGEGNEWG